jgi:hypothetical protein
VCSSTWLLGVAECPEDLAFRLGGRVQQAQGLIGVGGHHYPGEALGAAIASVDVDAARDTPEGPHRVSGADRGQLLSDPLDVSP